MSQFDFFSFSVQVFWTLLGFFTIYFYILFYFLPKLSHVIKLREKLKSCFFQKKAKKDFDLFCLFFKN